VLITFLLTLIAFFQLSRIYVYIYIYIKTYGSVLCGPRSRHATPWVYWQEERNWQCHFHTYVAPSPLIQIQTNLLQRCPPGTEADLHTKFEVNCSSLSQDTNQQILFLFLIFLLHYKTRMHGPIELKLGTHKGLVKRASLYKGIQGVMKDYKVKGLSRLQGKLLAGIRHVDRVIIGAVPFCGLKWIELKVTEIWNKTNLGQN